MKSLRFQYIGDDKDLSRYDHKVEDAEAEAIVAQLGDPNAVISIRSDGGTRDIYIPVRAVAQLRVEAGYGRY